VAAQHPSALLERHGPRQPASSRQRPPAPPRNTADLQSEVEALLREMAFVYRAARAVRESMTAARATHPRV
jgi:hypothetical protein